MIDKRNALVTGANRGIGFEIARQLGQQGFAVWLGCRNGGKGAEAVEKLEREGIEAQCLVLDVADADGVLKAASAYGLAADRLDVLVNNAGMHFGFPPPLSDEPVEQIETILSVNALGPVRVTQAFLPFLRKSGSARIVMMTSGLGSIAETLEMTSENWSVGLSGYCASKAALNMFTVKFAKELAPDGIKVNSVDPGLTKTDLGGEFASQMPEVAAAIAVEMAMLDDFGPNGGFFVNREAIKLPPQHRW